MVNGLTFEGLQAALYRKRIVELETALLALHHIDVVSRVEDDITLYQCNRCGGYLNNGLVGHRDWCVYRVLLPSGERRNDDTGAV